MLYRIQNGDSPIIKLIRNVFVVVFMYLTSLLFIKNFLQSLFLMRCIFSLSKIMNMNISLKFGIKIRVAIRLNRSNIVMDVHIERGGEGQNIN